MTKYYYNQADPRWAKKMYSSVNNPNQTMESSGCGPTAAAMLVSSFREVILPDKMADYFVSNGLRSANEGTYWSAFKWVSQKWQIEYEQTSSLDKAIEYLRNGGMVIAACSSGLFSVNGHLLLMVGIEGNNLLIYDSYLYNGKFETSSRKGKVSVNGTTIYCSINNFKQYANGKQYFCYKNTGTNSGQNNGNSTGKGTVGQIKTFKKNATIYENSNLTGKKYDYLANTTVEILENLGNVDKVKARATGRIGYVNNVGLYKEDVASTVGKVKTFKANTVVYENSNLTGKKYDYLANTTVEVLENLGKVDKIKVRATGRIGYVPTSVYK
jgi:hypothetical protein